ncbi:unnamed protein product [Trichobilharzia szidati]|nr:unnamed protein product [Trichobilharzia szidati]
MDLAVNYEDNIFLKIWSGTPQTAKSLTDYTTLKYMLRIVLTVFIISNVWIQNSNTVHFQYSANLNRNDAYSLKWSIDNQQKWLNFSVCFNIMEANQPTANKVNYEVDRTRLPEFFGIGFGQKDEPVGVEFYMLYFPFLNKAFRNDYEYFFMEGYTNENTVLQFRNSTESVLYKVNQIKTDHPRICFKFGRKAISCHENGYTINNQTTRVFLFHSNNEQLTLNDEIKAYWLYRFTMSPLILLDNIEMKQIPHKKLFLQLLKSPVYTGLTMNKHIHIHLARVEQVEIPAVETTYWCKTIELPYFSKEHHIIKYESDIIPASQGLVHHMEIFRCPGNANIPHYNAPCNSEMKPIGLSHCREVIAAWAMGTVGLTFPEEAGIPVGGARGREYAVIEIHYNNPGNLSGIIDNSGFRLYITSNRRPYDVGVMELGLVYSPNSFIPPRQSQFTLIGYCDTQCTDVSLPKPNGIFVFASQLHTHATGIKVVTHHLRNGTRLPDLNRDNYYSPHFQEIRQLYEQVQIKPGDSLITACTYNTNEREQVTFGGLGIRDEMCLNYIFYYPKVNLELCKSDVTRESLHSFLKTVDKK